ncbi:MAG: V-type ATP synthase subunit I [Halobacteria archaeon]
MLRPERMTKVSVAGSKSVMPDTIQTVHDLNLVHFTDYEGNWEGFDNGIPLEGSDEKSEWLVQIRSIQNQLNIEETEFEGEKIAITDISDSEIESTLDEVRSEVNELEDERNAVKDQIREVEEQKKEIEPFVELGISLELLQDYDSIDVIVGETDEPKEVKSVLHDAEDVNEFEFYSTETGIVAAAADMDEGASITDHLVGTDFTKIDVPQGHGRPEHLVEEFEARQKELRTQLEEIQEKRRNVREEYSEFLLVAEEKLSVDVHKTEVPLKFATTENSFVAEGWLPTPEVEVFEDTLKEEVGEHLEIRELETADYHRSPHTQSSEEENPPVKQENPKPTEPFELLVQVINRPTYHELDPTIVLFLTFPVMFGFMIGDMGYGVLYSVAGYGMMKKLDNKGLQALGGIALASGICTFVFGILYGELFGFHMLDSVLNKGLSSRWALVWLTVSVLAGLVHLNVGYIFGYANDEHGFWMAILENWSWISLMNGAWLWIFSKPKGVKPAFLIGPESIFNGDPLPLGFTGFPKAFGILGIILVVIGLVGVIVGEWKAEGGWIGGVIGVLESPNVLVNVLSYTRIMAVLLAKAGMAFAVNLLAVGGYRSSDGKLHLFLPEPGHGEVLFPGLINMGIGGIVAGIVILVLGHVLVFALGITSAGLQGVRLEYVEFFGKFYEGGGDKYQPFGHQWKFYKEQ